MTDIRTLINKLEPLAPYKLLIVSKIPTGVSLLSQAGDIVTSE